MQSPPNDIVQCTYLERVVPLPADHAAQALDALLRDMAVGARSDHPELRLGSGRTTFDVAASTVGQPDQLLLRSVPVSVRSGRIHRHDATVEIGPWSATASVVGLRVRLRRTPWTAEPGWRSYRTAGAELLTALAANLVQVHTAGAASGRSAAVA